MSVAGCDAASGGDGADASADTATAQADVAEDTSAQIDTEMAVDVDDATPIDDTMVSVDTAVSTHCPPSGPFGTGVGDVLADLTLYDCDGSPHRIADLCGRPASILTTFAGWCPVCRGDAAHANADYAGFKAKSPDFEWFFVITAADGANALNPAYCAAIRDDYGLTMPVLLDADGVFPGHIGVTSTNAWTVALDADGVIMAKDHYDESNAFAKVNALLE
ncbi:MAG: redoxin domain-containing protein [Deltaproteobacteria bacterium]|nr:MAG: redoxin domain-containing protein [Deltaproteobacteria bacterium]